MFPFLMPAALDLTDRPLPDLTITDFSWTPAHPQVGDEVTFRVTVKNVGAAPTPDGVPCGVGFGIDHNTPMNWSDTYTHAIRPGESVTLTANGGALGKATWTATGGDHPDGVWAHVNDAHRFAETDYVNNLTAKFIEISGSGLVPAYRSLGKPDLVITDFHAIPVHPKAGEPVAMEVTVKNQGTAPTPEGKKIGVGFFITYCDSAVLFTDTERHSLAPGRSVTLRTNGGAHEYPWLAPEGSYPILAYVNDTGEVAEADPGNNLLQKTLTVSGPAWSAPAGERLLTGAVSSPSIPAEPPWILAANAFDGNVGTCFITDANKNNMLQLALPPGGASPVTRIRFYPKPYSEADMVGGKFEGSNTGLDSAFETLATVEKTPNRGWNEIVLKPGKPYQYLRYLAADGSQCLVSEIEFYGPRREGPAGENQTPASAGRP